MRLWCLYGVPKAIPQVACDTPNSRNKDYWQLQSAVWCLVYKIKPSWLIRSPRVVNAPNHSFRLQTDPSKIDVLTWLQLRIYNHLSEETHLWRKKPPFYCHQQKDDFWWGTRTWRLPFRPNQHNNLTEAYRERFPKDLNLVPPVVLQNAQSEQYEFREPHRLRGTELHYLARSLPNSSFSRMDSLRWSLTTGRTRRLRK